MSLFSMPEYTHTQMQYHQLTFPQTYHHPHQSRWQKPKKRSAAEHSTRDGPCYVVKPHHTAPHQSRDSTIPCQTKLPAHRPLFSSHQCHWLHFSVILLDALVAILHTVCYPFFALSGYCSINSLNQIIFETQQGHEMHTAHH